MLISISACALQGFSFFATSVRRGTIAAGCTVALLTAWGPTANAQTVGDFYVAPFEASTGVVEWDTFTQTNGASPDVQNSGVGSTSFTLTSEALPMDGPPFPLVTTTNNIYTGGTITEFSVGLSELDATELNTTVVMQLAASSPTEFSGFQVNGLDPTEFVNRGSADGGQSTDANVPVGTDFLWAEWQLEDLSDLTLTFANTEPHQSLAGLRIDYFNSDSVTNVTAPAAFATAVPEPSSGLLLMTFVISAASRRRRS